MPQLMANLHQVFRYITMKITLEQWATFVAVVEEGSFAAAADKLNKSQSNVSYVLDQMKQRLPAPVLTLKGRKAVLTAPGKILYQQARHLLNRAQDLELAAEYMASGWEAEITLAIDAICSPRPLYGALENFSIHSPRTRVRLLETTLSGTEEALLSRKADIVLTGRVPTGFMGQILGEARMWAVVSPDHPLNSMAQPISEEVLRYQRQIVLRDTGIKREQDRGWLGSDQRWTVSHLSTSVDMVCSGLGFAFLPEDCIQEELEAGSLVKIQVEGMSSRRIPLHLVFSSQQGVGEGTKKLGKLILEAYNK